MWQNIIILQFDCVFANAYRAAVAQWVLLAAHGQWVVGSNFESDQVHWWCQEGHPTTIAPVLQ